MTSKPAIASPGKLCAVTEPTAYNHLLWLPERAAAEPNRRWPLMLFLHGAAERGSEVWNVTRQGAPKLLVRPPELTAAEQSAADSLAQDFIVIAPQCSVFEVWDEALLLKLLDSAMDRLPVDPRRIHIVGLSMGGFGAWMLAMRHPQRFAAIAAICGGGRLADIATALRDRPEDLRRLGVWAFHGACDVVVPLEESQRMVDALKAARVRDVRFTVYPKGEHDAWSETFANRELYRWLLQHERP